MNKVHPWFWNSIYFVVALILSWLYFDWFSSEWLIPCMLAAPFIVLFCMVGFANKRLAPSLRLVSIAVIIGFTAAFLMNIKV